MMREADDYDRYLGELSDEKRANIEAAGVAIDIALFLHDTRVSRGLSQSEAAKLAGIHQQTVSRFEQPGASPRLDKVQRYLRALGYSLELSVRDETGVFLISEKLAS